MKKMSLVAAIAALSWVGFSSFTSNDQPDCPAGNTWADQGGVIVKVALGGSCDNTSPQCKFYKDENGNLQPCDNEQGVYTPPPAK